MAELTGRPAPLGIAANLWDVLACPCEHHAPVTADVEAGTVLCTRCRTSFEVREGIPVMLIDEASVGPRGVGADVATEG